MAKAMPTCAPWRWRLVGALSVTLSLSTLAIRPAAAATVNVSAAGLAFAPARVTVAMTGGEPGAETPHGHVIWTVADPGQEHTVTFDDPRLVSSGRLTDGQRHEAVIYSPGTYTYRCTIHPGMTGSVVVTPAVAPESTATASGSPTSGGAGPTAESSSKGSVVPAVVGLAVLAAGAGLIWFRARRRRPATGAEPPD